MILSRIDNWHQLIDVVDDSVRFWKICTGNQMIDSKWFDTPQFRIIINNKANIELQLSYCPICNIHSPRICCARDNTKHDFIYSLLTFFFDTSGSVWHLFLFSRYRNFIQNKLSLFYRILSMCFWPSL